MTYVMVELYYIFFINAYNYNHFSFVAGNVLSAGPKKRRPYLLKRRANTTGNLKDKDDNGNICKYILIYLLLLILEYSNT